LSLASFEKDQAKYASIGEINQFSVNILKQNSYKNSLINFL